MNSLHRIFILLMLASCGSAPTVPTVKSDDGAWSDKNTWGGTAPPAPGANIEIPAGKTVILDRDTKAGTVTVNGTLEFADKDVTLEANWIMVHGSGVLRVGSEAKPFTKKARIVLSGGKPDDNTMGMGTKFLGAMMGGKIEMFGEPRTNWLRLNATAQPNVTTITLERDPGWRVGEEVVIAPSGYDGLETEARRIVAANGATLTLDAPLKHKHFGEMQTIDGQTLDERAEVGLLTRNVVVTSDADATGFGGHVMVMAGSSGRFSGVEFARLGQLGRMGRYGGPHWHLAGDASGQFVRGSSIHRSFNRFGSVHATNNVRLQNNVAFDAIGHGFILEDGVETGNVFDGNLAMLVRPPTAKPLIESDTVPSVFWMANPDNTFTNNVAAGAIGGNGFWYELPERPTGLSSPDKVPANAGVEPQRAKFGAFTGNVAHSNSKTATSPEVGAGLRFDQYLGGTSMSGLTSYRNDVGAWLASPTRSSDHRLSGFKLSGNRTATLDIFSTYTNALIVGTSANRVTNEPEKEGVHVYDGQTSLLGATVANFSASDKFLVFRGTTESTDNTSSFQNLRFVNSSAQRAELTSYYETHGGFDPATRDMLFDDADGSLLGGVPAWIVYRNPAQFTGGCTRNDTIGAYVCPKATHGYLRTGAYFDPGPEARLVRSDGLAVPLDYQYLLAGRTYRLEYAGSTRSTLSVGWFDPSGSAVASALPASDTWVRFVVPLPNWTGVREVHQWPGVASLAALGTCQEGCFHFDAATRELHVKVTPTSNTFVFEPR